VSTDPLHWDTGQDDTTNATIVINKNADTELDFSKVTVDFDGVVDSGGSMIQDGLDVIADLIETYANIAYVNANFDIEQWQDVQSDIPNIYLYVEKESTVIEEIEKITASIQAQFDVRGDGRYTVRVFDDTKAPVKTIEADEMFGVHSLEYNSDEFLSRVIVNYSNGLKYIYDDEEAEVNKRFKYKRPRVFDTLLVSSADATSFAERVMEFSGDPKALIEIETKTQNIDVNIEDNVIAFINRRASEWLSSVLCRVESVDIDLNDFTVTLGLRILSTAEVETGNILTSDGDFLATTNGETIIYYFVETE
jgi:hypothetical protein